jgi:hypothetical protein
MPLHALAFCFRMKVMKHFILWSLWFSVSTRETQRAQTFRYLKLFTFFWTAPYSVPVSAAMSLAVSRRLWLIISSSFPLLLSVLAVRGCHYGADRRCLFPNLKCFTHRLTLLAPMQASPQTRWSCVWIFDAWISSLTRNCITARCQNDLSSSATFSHWNITTSGGQVTWFSLWCEKVDGTSHVSRIAILRDICSWFHDAPDFPFDLYNSKTRITFFLDVTLRRG